MSVIIDNNKTDKKNSGRSCVVKRIVITLLICAVLLTPFPMFMKDGGTVRYQAILYSVPKRHEIAYPKIDGVEFYYNAEGFSNGFLVGTEVYVLFIPVYYTTHFEIENEYPYTPDVRDLVGFYQANGIEEVSLKSVTADEERISIEFYGDMSMEHANSVYRLMRVFLEENPDSFLNGNRTLFIDYVAREDTDRGHRQYYHVEFEFDPSTDTVCNVYVSGEMIPDEVPSDAVLEDIEATIDIHGETTDEKIEIIEGIYPNCTAA